MKYFVRIESEKGKQVSVSGNEFIDIDIYVGNRRIKAFTIREGDDGPQVFQVFDENDLPMIPMVDQIACENHAHYRANCPECKKVNR